MEALSGQHILLVAEYYLSGGTRTYALQLLDFYSRAGARVTLVTNLIDDDAAMQRVIESYKFARVTFRDVMAAAGFVREGHPTVWSASEFTRERMAFRRLAATIGADKVVVSFGTPGMFLSAAWSVANPIVIAHTYPHGLRQKYLGRYFLSRFIPRGTTFVAVSKYQAQIMRDMWRIDARNSSLNVVLSTYGEPAENFSQPHSPKLVLTASLVEGYKRPFDWIAVAERVASEFIEGDVTFRWLGEGTYFDKAQALALASTAPRHIQFPGVSRDPEPDYQECRVYLQLSAIENMSLSVIDAQRHGIPAVVTDVGGLPEIIEHNVNGFIVPVGDHDAATSYVRLLLTDNEIWARMSAVSLQVYESRHSPRAWEEAMLRLHASSA